MTTSALRRVAAFEPSHRRFSEAYAKQSLRDYQEFRDAIDQGRS